MAPPPPRAPYLELFLDLVHLVRQLLVDVALLRVGNATVLHLKMTSKISLVAFNFKVNGCYVHR